MLRFMLLIMLLAVSVPVRGQETLTLEQAIALAMKGNAGLQRMAFEIEKSEDRAAAARTQRLPSFEINLLESQTLTRLDFRFPQGIFGTYPTTGPIPAQDTKIGTPLRPITYLTARAAQPLSQFHRINLGLQLEATRGEAAREKLRAERQSVVREVKRIFYEMLSLQNSMETVEENMKLYRELDRVVGEYVAEKVALKAEGLDVKLQLATEELAALSLRNTLASRKEQFNALLGRDIGAEFRPSPVTEAAVFEMDLGAAQKRALDQRPEVKEAQLLVRQAELDHRIKRSQYIPDVSLVVNYLRIAPVSVIPPNIASVGVMMTWEPFDWGRRKRELSEKNRTIDQAKLSVRMAETQAMVEINGLFRRLQEARGTLQVARLAMDVSREKVRVATVRYSERAALLKEVLSAQSVMAETDRKYQQALLGFWEARANLEKAMGEE
ncbi:MAG: TolC family protein [Blastocatellia bacterium]|nr:TolC family protein [Blastocatellia bacterium]